MLIVGQYKTRTHLFGSIKASEKGHADGPNLLWWVSVNGFSGGRLPLVVALLGLVGLYVNVALVWRFYQLCWI